MYYRLNPDLPAWFNEVLRITSAGNASWLSENTTRLNTMVERPKRNAHCC